MDQSGPAQHGDTIDARRTPTNELAVVAVVCGALALAAAIVPALGVYIFGVFAIPGLIFGLIGFRTGLRYQARRGVATTALVLVLASLLATAFWVAAFPFLFSLFIEH